MILNYSHGRYNRTISSNVASRQKSHHPVFCSMKRGDLYCHADEQRALLFDFPISGILGYVIAGITGLWLVIAILRSGRFK